MRITFDTNSWQRVVRPHSFPKDPRQSSFIRLHEAAQQGTIEGFICEVVGTLEAVMKRDRGTYLAGRRSKIESTTTVLDDGQIKVSLCISPDHSQHPGLAGILNDSLEDAFALGFRLLSTPRVGMNRPALFVTPDGSPRPDLFVQSSSEDALGRRLDRFGEIVREIEGRGVGRAVAVHIARGIEARTDTKGKPWFSYLNKPADPAEEKAIAKAVAEWADGDAVASHIAYGMDVFCTEDAGKSAGQSILDPTNRTWLAETHGVQFETLESLAARIAA